MIWLHMVNVGPVTPEFKMVKLVHPLVDDQFCYVCLAAPMLDLAGISTECYWAIIQSLLSSVSRTR